MKEALKQTLRREGDTILWVVELLSGVSLLLYAVLNAITPDYVALSSSINHGFSHLAARPLWIAAIAVIGALQIVCSIHRNPLCTVLTSYPATVACLFAGVAGCLFGPYVEPLSLFAVAWGILNYMVVRHNWKKAAKERDVGRTD